LIPPAAELIHPRHHARDYKHLIAHLPEPVSVPLLGYRCYPEPEVLGAPRRSTPVTGKPSVFFRELF